MRWIWLVGLAGCYFPNPMSDAKELCEGIRDAEVRYFQRCAIEPTGPMQNCDRVWDTSASEEQLRACAAALDAAECWTLDEWPPSCPRGAWVRLPWN